MNGSDVLARPAVVSWRARSKVVIEATTAGLALLAAAVTGDAALVAFAAPLAVAAVFGLSRRRPSEPRLCVTVEPTVIAPGDPITVSVDLLALAEAVYEVAIALPPGLVADANNRWTIRLRAGERRDFELVARATRPGRFRVGSVNLAMSDPSGCLVATGRAGTPITVEVRPVAMSSLAVVRSEKVRATTGDRVARLAGDGIEIADVREQPQGALGRRINWRASARRGITCVNLHHPERSTDVVLLVDTFSASEIPAAVSIAVNLAEAYSRYHDRLGLIAFGGVLDWVEPGTGPLHLERVRRALLSSEAFFSYAWKTADVIPRRLFPSGCLVLAISPLGDTRFVSTLASLRSRGIDLAVVELAAPGYGGRGVGVGDVGASAGGGGAGAGAGPGAPPPVAASPNGLARRIVTLERQELRHQLWRWGVPVVAVRGPGDIAGALAEIAAFRRAHSTRPVARR